MTMARWHPCEGETHAGASDKGSEDGSEDESAEMKGLRPDQSVTGSTQTFAEPPPGGKAGYERPGAGHGDQDGGSSTPYPACQELTKDDEHGEPEDSIGEYPPSLEDCDDDRSEGDDEGRIDEDTEDSEAEEEDDDFRIAMGFVKKEVHDILD